MNKGRSDRIIFSLQMIQPKVSLQYFLTCCSVDKVIAIHYFSVFQSGAGGHAIFDDHFRYLRSIPDLPTQSQKFSFKRLTKTQRIDQWVTRIFSF